MAQGMKSQRPKNTHIVQIELIRSVTSFFHERTQITKKKNIIDPPVQTIS